MVGEENVSIVENTKYLGVIVDRFLSWDEQISAVMEEVSRGLGMLHFSIYPLLLFKTCTEF